jgi:hypothetical protein
VAASIVAFPAPVPIPAFLTEFGETVAWGAALWARACRIETRLIYCWRECQHGTRAGPKGAPCATTASEALIQAEPVRNAGVAPRIATFRRDPRGETQAGWNLTAMNIRRAWYARSSRSSSSIVCPEIGCFPVGGSHSWRLQVFASPKLGFALFPANAVRAGSCHCSETPWRLKNSNTAS